MSFLRNSGNLFNVWEFSQWSNLHIKFFAARHNAYKSPKITLGWFYPSVFYVQKINTKQLFGTVLMRGRVDNRVVAYAITKVMSTRNSVARCFALKNCDWCGFSKFKNIGQDPKQHHQQFFGFILWIRFALLGLQYYYAKHATKINLEQLNKSSKLMLKL